MKVSTLVVLMTALFALGGGLYLLSESRPDKVSADEVQTAADPQPAKLDTAKALSGEDAAAAKSVAKALPFSRDDIKNFPNYWAIREEWREIAKEKTSIQTRGWVDDQRDLRVVIPGKLNDAYEMGNGGCLVFVKQETVVSWPSLASFTVPCAVAGQLNKGDGVVATCTLGGLSTSSNGFRLNGCHLMRKE